MTHTISLADVAESVLAGNWLGDHTVPARTLYPHQWSWDTAFIAIGLAHVNPADRDYFPGPSFWQGPTSCIVQPPVHAYAAWLMNLPASFYPQLVAQQTFLHTQRNLGGAGLVSIVHPWESGLDNSPAWDLALSSLPALSIPKRRDIEVSVAAHRPTDRDYARYIALAAAYRDGAESSFLVECPAFNTLTILAELSLASMAVDPAPHRARAAAMTSALVERLYDPSTGMFHALDVRTGLRSPARYVGGPIPLLLPDLRRSIVEGLISCLTSPRFGLPAPSYDRTASDFDPLRYWRGPVWINMNWLLWRGLLVHGREELAASLRASLLSLVERSGCFEYFDPDTGQGIGTPGFSWTAALAIDLLRH